MPIKRPDIYEHNNPNDAFVDSDFVRGGIRTTADTLNDLYDLSGKTDQLKVYATKVYVVSEEGYYILKDINNVDNINGWIREDVLVLSNVSGFTATTISATTYENLPKIQNLVIVAKSGGEFTSIKTAVDSILDSAENNRYVVKVEPGLYYEDEIDLTTKPYVSIVGSSINTTSVYPNSQSQNLIKIGQFSDVSFLTLNDVGSGYSAIYCDDIGDFALAHKISFYDCDINVNVISSTQDTKFYGEFLDFNGSYSFGTKIVANNGYSAYANMENYYNYPTGTGTTIANKVQGSGATLSVFVGDGVGNGVNGSTNYEIFDYASLNTISTTADKWDYGVRVLNVGGPATFDIDSYSVVDSYIYDLSIEHPLTFGTFGGGSSSHAKIYNLSENIYWSFLDIEDGEFEVTRKISVTFRDGTHTDASTLIFRGGTMGLISGGTIQVVSGLTVGVSNGFGYLQKTALDDIVMRIDWLDAELTLPQNINYYIYINENSIFSTSGTRPNSENNIILGRVVTDSIGVNFIDESPLNASHTSNRFGNLFREALGPIYAFGSIVTEANTAFTLNITSGEYYYSSNEYKPSGGSGFTFNQYYNDGLGGWNISATTIVNNTQFDNNGVLSGLTTSAFTKHTLYLVGDGVNEKYLLVLGQNQYNTLVEAEEALLPTPPSYFVDSVTEVANIYIRQGSANIIAIEDIRPTIGFKAGGINASSLHANLLGLNSDDHKQYLLVDGSRAMSNNLDMGGNAILSALTVNGVTVEAHASRHKNGGADEIATATPSPSEIPKADTFGKLDGWISDSSSSVKGLTKLSVDPTSASNPIAVGVNDTRFLNSISGVSNTTPSLVFTNNSGGTTTFSNLNLSSISATTYYGLPLDIRVTGATFDNTTNVAEFTNNTGGTFSVTIDTDLTAYVPYNGADDDITLDKHKIIFNQVDDAFAIEVNSLADSTPRVNMGIVASGHGFLNLFDKTGSLITNIENGNITTNRFIVNGGTSDQYLMADGSLSTLPTFFDVFVTGGTYSTGTATFTNNTGGTFTVTGFSTGGGGSFTGGTVTGPTNFTAGLTANTISATTYQNLPLDIRVTGGTYNAGTATFTNNTGGTFTVTGFSTGSGTFTGGTVTGPTNFTNGLSANTISATTYFNLPIDIRVTGGTYNAGTATFTNNTGGTFTVTGFSTGSGTFTGGTVTGPTNFTAGLSANTISATTYFNLPVTANTFTTAFTYSNNVFTLSRNQGLAALTATINTMTGLTINGALTVTGATALNGVISSTALSGSTDRIVQVSSVGGVSASIPIITAYITSGGTVANLLENTSNWDIDGNYTGTTITGTYQGQKHYNGNYFFEAVADNLFIRLIRG